MNSIVTRYSRIVSTLIMTWFIMLDGISAVAVGLLYYFLIGIGDYTDPIVDFTARQQALFALSAAFIYLVICIISLLYWSKGKRYWAIFLVGVAITHFVGTTGLKLMSNDIIMSSILTILAYFSLLANCLLIFLVYKENARVSSLQGKTG